ncbi:MAG: dCTP deaminase, partial [Nanoarchaeota archaeon]
MLLSDKSIKEAIKDGRIVIKPHFPECVQPSSIDVHLDSKFLLFNRAKHGVIDVKQKQDELMSPVEIKEDEPFILHPGEFVLGSTLEFVKLPNDIAGR